jgi:hypothetical protein
MHEVTSVSSTATRDVTGVPSTAPREATGVFSTAAGRDEVRSTPEERERKVDIVRERGVQHIKKRGHLRRDRRI